MKIAITADVHLTTSQKHPERYHALENILNQMLELRIGHLIIAGDLFDSACQNPGGFESFLQNNKYEQLHLYAIPGNHDPALTMGGFTLPNFTYCVKETFIPIAPEISFLFIPYKVNSTIGEALAASSLDLKAGKWVLIAHGDYLGNTRSRNLYESGLYMPLSRRDIQNFKPIKVFLGHIHAPLDEESIHVPGSPCGLDITETGIRSFIIYDTETNQTQRLPIKTDHIFMQENLILLPMKEEVPYIQQTLKQKISNWKLNEQQKSTVKLRVTAKGFSTNRDLARKVILEFLNQENITLYEAPDLSSLRPSNDTTREDIANKVQKLILAMDFLQGLDEPTVDEYTVSALNQIYGAKL